MITQIIDKKYYGWKITLEGIELIRIDFLKGRESIFIKNNIIKSIKYVQSQPRIPTTYIFNTTEGEKTLIPRVNIYKFAPLLKYFYNKDIPINYSLSDHEVDLYIKGRIDSLPMTNDMKIKTKANKS